MKLTLPPMATGALLDDAGASAVGGRHQHLGFVRIVASEIEIPNILANMVWSG